MQEFQSIPGLAGRLFGGAATPAPTPTPTTPSSNNAASLTSHHANPFSTVDVAPPAPIFADQAAALASLFAPPPLPVFTFADAKNPRRASASSPRSNGGSGSASPTAAATPVPAPSPTTPATPSSNNVASLTSHHTNPFSTVDVAPPAPIFADQAAALASLFAPPPPPPLPVFTFAAQPKEESSAAASALQLAGQAAPSEAPSSASADMAPFASLDASGMFDLGDASAAAYWSAGSCWTDVQDPSMYLP